MSLNTTIAFSGSREGGTSTQVDNLEEYLSKYSYETFLAHHGMCKGFDCIFAKFIRKYSPNCHIVGHPCTITACQVTDIVECPRDSTTEVLKPLKRNAVMVDASGHLLACPPCMENPGRGGTWWTIEYAKKNKRNHTIFFPDGTIKTYLGYFEKYYEVT